MARIAYLLLTSDSVGSFTDAEAPEAPLYTRDFLKGTLQLMGCKPRYAEKLTESAFGQIEAMLFGVHKRQTRLLWRMHPRGNGTFWVSIPQRDFTDFMMRCIQAHYAKTSTIKEDWTIATSLRERRRSVTILLCGTSGTGKSTLASLLASRLRISTVVSTDCIRNMLRSLASSEREHPLIFASSYDAGDALRQQHAALGESPSFTPTKLTVKGFKAQSESVLQQLEHIITEAESRHESLICEGVHLSLNFVIRLMRSHPTILPFLIHIRNEEQHMERFSVRAKYMTRDSSRNRYVHHLSNIRNIQDFLVRKAEVHLIPKVNNTNVDRSVAAIHQTTFGCLRRLLKGESLYDATTNTAKLVHQEFHQIQSTAEWKAKGALAAIRSKYQEKSDLCLASASSAVEDEREELSDDLTATHYTLERAASSGTNDELVGSDCEDSSDGSATEPAQTEYGSLMETTDLDDHDE